MCDIGLVGAHVNVTVPKIFNASHSIIDFFFGGAVFVSNPQSLPFRLEGLDRRTGSLHLGPFIRALYAPHWNSFLPSSPEALRTYRRDRPVSAREEN
jgi:hypothetical protein